MQATDHCWLMTGLRSRSRSALPAHLGERPVHPSQRTGDEPAEERREPDERADDDQRGDDLRKLGSEAAQELLNAGQQRRVRIHGQAPKAWD